MASPRSVHPKESSASASSSSSSSSCLEEPPLKRARTDREDTLEESRGFVVKAEAAVVKAEAAVVEANAAVAVAKVAWERDLNDAYVQKYFEEARAALFQRQVEVAQRQATLDELLLRSSAASASATASPPRPPQLNPFNAALMVSLSEVQVPPAPKSPPFISEDGWLDKTVECVKLYCAAEDGPERVPPMALVRCSRGGKTRTLKELGTALKALTRFNVIFISLNDYSSIDPWEEDDGVGAVCRRIAFAASKDRDFAADLRQYRTFAERKWDVRPEQLTAWLDGQSCVLLIDELNNLPQSPRLSKFLKDHFLSLANRYLVFSSHVLAVTGDITRFMDSNSNRNIVIRELPLIPSLRIAQQNFGWASLNARQALYYGKVPALIYEAHLDDTAHDGVHLPIGKRRDAINMCFERELVTYDKVTLLLRSFIDGDEKAVMDPLRCLMSSRSTDEDPLVQWIPFHMMKVLSEFGTRVQGLRQIVRLFESFKDAKVKSGDGWESLFVAVLLIRCWTQISDGCILPFEIQPMCTFTFNKLFQGRFETERVDEFVADIVAPTSFPHISVYYPPHASFQLYDVVLAHYDDRGDRKLYGYQLKEGKALPTETAMSSVFEASFVIRGEATRKHGVGKDWVRPSEAQIQSFFGVSGQHWTPQNWNQLNSVGV